MKAATLIATLLMIVSVNVAQAKSAAGPVSMGFVSAPTVKGVNYNDGNLSLSSSTPCPFKDASRRNESTTAQSFAGKSRQAGSNGSSALN